MVVLRLGNQQRQQQGDRHYEQDDCSEPPYFLAGMHCVQYIEASPCQMRLESRYHASLQPVGRLRLDYT